jgi:hypothetical protein
MVLLLKKRIGWRCIPVYPICGALFSPLLVYVITKFVENKGKFWPAIPDINGLINLWTRITGRDLLTFMFIAGTIVSIAIVLLPEVREFMNARYEQAIIGVILAFAVFFTIALVFVYSRFINPHGSLFVERYFISILPALLIVAGIGAGYISKILFNGLRKAVVNTILAAIICALSFFMGRDHLQQLFQLSYIGRGAYEQASEWIYAQESAHRQDALVTMTGDTDSIVQTGTVGFNYYITHNGQRPPLNIGWLSYDTYRDWNIVYRYDGHFAMNPNEQAILDEYYELVDEYQEGGMIIYVYEKKNG